MTPRRFVVIALAPIVLAAQAPDPALTDADDEARARGLMRELACMVCDGQAIDSSNAPVAVEMRTRVRDLVEEGLTDAEVRARMAARYGEGVLLRPPATGAGLALWLAPFVLIGLAAAIAFAALRRRAPDDVNVGAE